MSRRASGGEGRGGAGDAETSSLYFAYGSNLSVARMTERVPGARLATVARLPDHEVVCDKAGADGSAKANLKPRVGGEVWGVVYRLDVDGLDRLDPFEGGYFRFPVGLEARDGAALRAVTYRSDRIADDPRPFDWYLELIVEGAQAHDLPADYVARLAAWPCRPDPRRSGDPGAR